MGGYLTGGAGGGGFLMGDQTDPELQKTQDFVNQQEDVRQKKGVDAAIRAGVGDMMDNGGSTYYHGAGAGGYQPPMMGGGATVMPVGTPTPAAGPSAGPVERPSLAAGTQAVEDPTGKAVNPLGYVGAFQQGVGELTDAGVFHPTANGLGGSGGPVTAENNWASGTIDLPNHGRMSFEQFRNSPEAQKEAWDLHQVQLGKEIANRHLAEYEGQTISGVPITEDAIRAGMHFAGPTGMQRFLDTGGAYDKADVNGMTISRYIAKATGTGDVSGAPAATVAFMNTAGGTSDPTMGGMGPNPGFNARYDPILSRLAQAPGGGATALQIMAGQSRYDMGMQKRGDTYARLGMAALAKGDTQMAQVMLGQAGINVPPQLLQAGSSGQRFGQASLIAERLYGQDKAGAQRFVSGFMQTGDMAHALQAAGPPADQPHLSIQQLYDAGQGVLRMYGVVTQGPNAGQVIPLQQPGAAPGTQLTASPKPNQGLEVQQWKQAHPQGATATDAGRVFDGVFGGIMRNDPNKTAAAAQQEAEQVMVSQFGQNWRTGWGGTASANATPSPAPGGFTNTPPPPPPGTPSSVPAPAPAAAPAPEAAPAGPRPGVPGYPYPGDAAPAPTLGQGAPAALPAQPAGAHAPPVGPPIAPAAAARLKEGVVTTFTNGQRWTLQHGQPVFIGQQQGGALPPGAA